MSEMLRMSLKSKKKGTRKKYKKKKLVNKNIEQIEIKELVQNHAFLFIQEFLLTINFITWHYQPQLFC